MNRYSLFLLLLLTLLSPVVFSGTTSPAAQFKRHFDRLTAKNTEEKKDYSGKEFIRVFSQGVAKPNLLHKDFIRRAGRYHISFEMELSNAEADSYGLLLFDKGALRYPLYNDKRLHAYNWRASAENMDLGNLRGIVFTNQSQQIKLRNFSLSAGLRGDGDVMLLEAEPAYLLPDENGKAVFSFLLCNTGAKKSEKLKLTQFRLPNGVKTPRASSEELPDLSAFEHYLHQVEVEVSREQDGKFQLKYSGKDIPTQSFQGELFCHFRSPLPGNEIQPLPTALPVGAFYRTEPVKWQKIRKNTPFRKPVYGEYQPGDTEYIAWQTRHLAENGISFLFADWYWNKGNRLHAEWENAFRDSDAVKDNLLSFAPVWRDFTDNISNEDFEAAVAYLIKEHFTREFAFRIDSKPVLILPLLSGNGMKDLLDRAQDMAAKSELPGICFISLVTPEMIENRKLLQEASATGISLIVCENPVQPNKKADDPGRADFSSVISEAQSLWSKASKQQFLQLIPTLSSGYDDTPLFGPAATRIVNRDRKTFEKHCRDALSFAERRPVKLVLTGPLNDWENGSYLEPDETYGFDFYETIRDTFAVKGTRKDAVKNLFPLMKGQ